MLQNPVRSNLMTPDGVVPERGAAPSGSAAAAPRPGEAALPAGLVDSSLAMAMLQDVLESMSDGFFAYDTEWRCVHLNDAARRLLLDAGTDPDRVLGRVIWDVIPGLAGSTFHEHMLRCARERVPIRFEAPGSITGRWVETTAIPTAGGVAAFSHDIGDRRRTAMRERLLVSAGALLSQPLELEPALRAVARAAVDEFCDTCVVTLERTFTWGPSLEVVESAPAQAASGDEPAQPGLTLVVPLQARDRRFGTLTFTRRAGAPPYDDDDRRTAEELGRRAAVAIDNARLFEAERTARLEAEAARTEAEAASKAKSDFLAMMSHELRTPLNAIAGYVELLAMGIRGPITAEQQLDLDRIRNAQQTLLKRINDVLSFARLEVGQVEFELTDVAVAELLEKIEPLVMPQVRARGIDYECTPCDPSLRVRADAEKAGQVMLNLVANAVKFTPAGGRVVLSALPAPDGRVVISVRDTGVGIPADNLESIFDPFVQVDTRLTREHGGTGLGLAISRDLLRGMGGDLSVQSTVGSGSVFRMSLPAA